MRKSSKCIQIIVLIAALCLAIVIGSIYYKNHQNKINVDLTTQLKIDGLVLPKSRVIQPFALTDMNGQVFNKDNLVGHWNLIFFGFTNCGYVCPTTLSALNTFYRQIKTELPENQIPRVIFVTVDPDRDTLERMKSYVTSFNPEFVGVRGELPEVKAFANQMSVVFAKVESPNNKPNDYSVTHSAEIMVIDPNGNLRAFFSYPHESVQLIQDYKKIVNTLSS